MPLTVHRTLRQRLGDGHRERWILEPRNVDPFVEPLLGERCQEAAHFVVIGARRRLQLAHPAEILHLRDRERRLAIADDPAECALHKMQMMQAGAQRRVVGSRGGDVDGPPVLGVGPFLVSIEIAQQWVHES